MSPSRTHVVGQALPCAPKVAEMLLCIRSLASWTAIARDAEMFLAALERLRRPRVLSEQAHQSAPASKRLLLTKSTAGPGRHDGFAGVTPSKRPRVSRARARNSEELIRVPFADVTLLERLDGSGGAAVYRRIARLRSAGLVGTLRPSIDPGHGPVLLYVTDLGLAAVAVAQQADPLDVARRFTCVERTCFVDSWACVCFAQATICWGRSLWPARAGHVWRSEHRSPPSGSRGEAPHHLRDPRLRRAGLG